jgi:hypothetical protein
MKSIPISFVDLLTTIYVMVDDWHQETQPKAPKKRGVEAVFSDSEVITLMLAHDYLPYPGETQFLGHIRANYLDLFPKLLDQPQYNRRARGLRAKVEGFRQRLVKDLIKDTPESELDLLLDTKPIPVLGYKRNKNGSDFLNSAGYGVCVSRKLQYFGYKLVALTTLEGLPLVYDLVPANTDERVAAETVLLQVAGADIFGDKGFIGEFWQADMLSETDNRIWTPKRVNQIKQNSPEFDRWLSGVRERIEGAFHEVQNTGRHLEHLIAKTVVGLVSRIVAKMASHALRTWLRRFLDIDVLTFSIAKAH